jgi:Uma2 family endonuclease
MEDSLKGDLSVAPFIIEVISNHDKLSEAETKLNEYFAAGVQVVWQVIPVTETVKVYTSPKQVTICSGSDLCSAAPVLAEFQIPAQQVFGK